MVDRADEDLKEWVHRELKKQRKILISEYKEILFMVQTPFTIWISETSPSFHFITPGCLESFNGVSDKRKHISCYDMHKLLLI